MTTYGRAPFLECSSRGDCGVADEIVYMDYKSDGKKLGKEIPVTLLPLPRTEFPQKVILDKLEPLVCKEFCDKHLSCHLKEQSMGDLCSNYKRLGSRLVHPVSLKWRVRFDAKFEDSIPKTNYVRSSISGSVPEEAYSHDRTGEDEFAGRCAFTSDIDEEMEMEDARCQDASEHIPAFIFKTTHRDVRQVAFDEKDGHPYYKWISVPNLRPIGCLLKMQDGKLVSAGKVSANVVQITRNDKTRMQDFGTLNRQKRQSDAWRMKIDALEARIGHAIADNRIKIVV